MAALRELDILYTPSEERFDRITRLAARTLHAQIALVSLVSDNEQWFKSAKGLQGTATPRELSFCGHAILEAQTFVVEDASADPRFADNPFVTGEPKVRFYAGQPVRAPDGSPLGTLCVIDSRPRKLSDEDRATLCDLAELVEAEFARGKMSEVQHELIVERTELQRKAMIDGLTRLWNRSAIFEALTREIGRARRSGMVSVAMIDVDFFKKVNDAFGHSTGDQVLSEVGARLRRCAREGDIFGRYGGEEFLGVFSNCDEQTAQKVGERVRSRVAESYFETDAEPLPITVSVGIATLRTPKAEAATDDLAATLVSAADKALYRAKEAGRNTVMAAGA